MLIIEYVFLGLAAIAFIAGLVSGFAKTLFGLLLAGGSVAVAVIFTPTVAELDFVVNLIEDTPIVINGTELFFLRKLIVFVALFVLTLLVLFAFRSLFLSILKNAKLLAALDKILGGAFNVAVVWVVFGVIYALSSVGTEWIAALDEQLASTGVNLGLAQICGDIFNMVDQSEILHTVYSTFNPVGDLVAGMLLA